LNLLLFLNKKLPYGEKSPKKITLVPISIQNIDGICSFFYIHIFYSQILQIVLWMIATSTMQFF
jgi:hypothetical protein